MGSEMCIRDRNNVCGSRLRYAGDATAAAQPNLSTTMVFYYGVAGGTDAGVYENWPAAEQASRGKKGARVKKFTSQEDALDFVQAGGKSEVLVDNNGKWRRNEEGYLYRPEGIRPRTGSTYSTATIGFVEGAVICGLCHREGDTTQAVGMSLFLMHSIKPYASTNHRICEGCQSMLDFLLANVAQPLNLSLIHILRCRRRG